MSYEFTPCEKCTCLLALEEASSAESFSAIPACVLSRLSLTAEKSFCNASEMESYRDSQSGMTSGLLTEIHGEEKSMSYAEGSHAKELAQQDLELDWKTHEADYGKNKQGSFAKLDQTTSLWKIPTCSPGEDWMSYCGTWPKWGMMHDGECWELATPERLTKECEYGLWPTPSGVRGRGHCVGAISEWGGSSNPFRGTKDRNLRCPDFEEWIMGWPRSWTELTPYGMDKFQQWLHSHGEFCQEVDREEQK